MPRPKSKITLYNKELFDQKIIEVFDPIHNQRYWFVRCRSSQEFTEILTQIIPNYQQMVADSESDERVDGECVDLVLEGKLVIILWCNITDIGALTHECLHAVLFSARSRGISLTDDESLCYMLEFLVEEILTTGNVRLTKVRKPKSKPESTQLTIEFNKPEEKTNG